MLEEVIGTDDFKEDLDIDLVESCLLDSLGLIEIILKIEDYFGIKLKSTEVERESISTPNKFLAFIKSII